MSEHQLVRSEIVIVTMLRKVEFSAINDVFKAKWPRASFEELPGSTLFFRANCSSGWSPRVAIRCINGAGNLNAAVETTNMLSRFSPRFAFLCGIAGNIDHQKCRLGDVVVGDGFTFRQYTRVSEGKKLESTDPPVNGFSQHMRDVSHRIVSEIQPELNGHAAETVAGGSIPHENKCMLGKIFCWDMVLDCNETRAEIHDQDKKLKAVEMEAAGFYQAIDAFKRLRRTKDRDYPLDGVIFRGLSDPASGKKQSDGGSTNWRGLSARNAAVVLADFIDAMHEGDCEAVGF
ncbi:5'-methylthioadenosine/S-adenosylhomocysteine nucleosidase family protein [Ruegeria arenilitoris]|uniref:5'-methylthioadenosine/S-adenosylhomocysteine nucleosidase family protein n=1 Tax=Ruegeria arenilitoris TaxID=1173585 RepID=UPI00147D6835|nr:hypothetical protein [Ruegeria arenilitoris]